MNSGPDHTPTVQWVLFGFRGRIGRKSYLLAALFMILVQAVVLTQIIATEGTSTSALWGLAMLVVLLLSAWASLAMAVKRLHDIGLPGPLAICLLIPAISLFAFLFLAVMPPSKETNQHGPPPFPRDD
ncbi:DUF805 domain-containing protein [Oricola sp.]|uniref:DUF805 domain-containing protein n=1 Tax=Oricola sp. TaxID=1979950 RepID=UPI003BABD7B4